jgi:polyisoprenoid-binding protein YceI
MTSILGGTYAFGPADGSLLVKVFKEGVAAKMGHNLVFEVKNWNAKAVVDSHDPSATSIEATAEVPSFSIIDATGGAKALGRSDMADIKKNIEEKVLDTRRFPTVSFRTTGVASVNGETATLNGDLTIKGTSRPVQVKLALSGGRAKATFTVIQSSWGIKPFSAMMGALKVKDSVEIELEVPLPA